MKCTITEEELLQLLDRAYEAGWSGYKDLKEFKIFEIAEEFCKSKPPMQEQKELFTTGWVNSGPIISNGMMMSSSTAVSSGYPVTYTITQT